jgi:RNA polymerase sigma-70 factor (ECF subfamily)
VFRDYNRLVYRTAYGITGTREDAEDVLQTLFLRLLGRGISEPASAQAAAYLYRAAVNLSVDSVRAYRRRKLREDCAVLHARAFNPSSDDEEERHSSLHRAMAGLDAEVIQLLVLRYVHNHSDAEIATMLGTSRGVIAVRLFRARAKIKKLLASFDAEPVLRIHARPQCA